VASAAVALLATGAAVAPKVETIGPLNDASVPEAVRSTLEPKGARLLLPEGVWCDVWLRKSILEEKNPTPGALRTDLGISALLGVIRFVNAASDFRGQAIRPGFYTLRYANIPNDGDHLGVADYPDFLLVVPASDDPDPGRQFKVEKLVSLSTKATGTSHPGVFSLSRPSGDSFPSVTVDDSGHLVLQMKATIGTRESPIALIVKGRAQQ
jgi:hypothetical protein